MIEWSEKSDSRSTFFTGASKRGFEGSIEISLAKMFDFMNTNILGKGNATQFDVVLLEINCDTGRIVAGASTLERRDTGRIDGCSIRLQSLQDHWYDLVERGRADVVFAQEVRQKVSEIGELFRRLLIANIEELRQKCSAGGFTYILYGSDPGISYFSESFSIGSRAGTA